MKARMVKFMGPEAGNLFSDARADVTAERMADLARGPHVRIERIVSLGQATPTGVWLEEDKAEWVVLLSGAASLRFELEDALRMLRAGDWVLIAARARHRVEWTSPEAASVWLAVHFDAPED